MKRISSILTFLVTAMLAVSACAPQRSTPTSSTAPEATHEVMATSVQAEMTPEPTLTPLVDLATSEQTAKQTPQSTVPAPVASAGSGQTAEATPELTVTPPVDAALGGQTIVSLDDQGKTIQIAAGQSFLLKLGDLYVWEVTLSDQNVVSRAKNIAVVRGAQGVYDALQAGTVTLTASGDPLCRQSKPACGMPSILFTVTIVVK